MPQQLSIQTFDSDLARACDRMLSSLHVDSNTGGNAVAPLLDPAFAVDLRMGSLGYSAQWIAPIGRSRCFPQTGAAPASRWPPRFFKLIGDGLQILWGEPMVLQASKIFSMDSCTKSLEFCGNGETAQSSSTFYGLDFGTLDMVVKPHSHHLSEELWP